MAPSIAVTLLSLCTCFLSLRPGACFDVMDVDLEGRALAAMASGARGTASEHEQCLAPVEAVSTTHAYLSLALPCLAGLAALVVGYVAYGAVINKIVDPDDDKETPAFSDRDDVDFLPLPDAKVFLIQLLNIAGLGPIFGPILGAVYGAWAFAWIILGCIFFGATVDFLCGKMSIDAKGVSMPQMVGQQLGPKAKHFASVLTLLLLILVGVVFVKGPAALLAELCNDALSKSAWSAIIFGYYIIATLLPIDKIIGKIYPFFGVVLLFMTFGLLVTTLASGREFPDLKSAAIDARDSPYPTLCIIISCSALSGFHSTQTPMMARCIKRESSARRIFYGAMISEGAIGFIWALASLTFFGGRDGLAEALACTKGNPSPIVEHILTHLLGRVGGIVAIVGVIVLPITTGDTAFRAARLIVAEWFGCTESQRNLLYRVLLALPLFAIAFVLSMLNFSRMWLYLNFVNQFVAALMLWSAVAWMLRSPRRRAFHWVATVPACWMTLILATYVLQSKEFGTQAIPMSTAYPVGAAIATVVVGAVSYSIYRRTSGDPGEGKEADQSKEVGQCGVYSSSDESGCSSSSDENLGSSA